MGLLQEVGSKIGEAAKNFRAPQKTAAEIAQYRNGRRNFLETAAKKSAGVAVGAVGLEMLVARSLEAGGGLPPFEQGKFQTFPGLVMVDGAVERPILQQIDVGKLGPDVDTLFGIDFPGNIPTGAEVVYQPADAAHITETRVVGLIRTDLDTVQFANALRGDLFFIHKASDYMDNAALDQLGKDHAIKTARTHQKVVYVHDLGLLEKQFGDKERPLLNRIIRAQLPARPDIGIQPPNFVNHPVTS